MPTYEYACPRCGVVEAYQSIKDAALTTCPQCRKAKVTRMVSSGAGVIFKGSGFWETDYNRSADYQKKKKEESAAPAKPEAKPEAKPQAAPAAAPAAAPSAPAPKP
jgi:putative FmdB family regulatory protein